jgi:hypothetical protein
MPSLALQARKGSRKETPQEDTMLCRGHVVVFSFMLRRRCTDAQLTIL